MAAKKTTKKKSNISKQQADALKELSNITSGNATTALSKMLSKKVEISIPKAEFLKTNDLTKKLGGPKRMVMSIYLQIHGELTGQSVFLFQRKAAMELVDIMLGRESGETKVLDHLAESAFGEMANIFVGTYLNALSDMLNLKILPGIPVVANDYVEPILDYAYGRIENPEKKMLCFRTKVKVEDHNVDGEYVFMFDESSFNLVLENLESKFGVQNIKK